MIDEISVADTMSQRPDGWADPVHTLTVKGVPSDAMNLNVDGREVTGALQGFGQLWQKTYRIRLERANVTPKDVVTAWKANFGKFWPPGSYFYGSGTGISPGDVAVINNGLPGIPVFSTGILVVYVDDESFSFMTPRGHMFCAMINFSAFDEDGVTVAQVQPLIRANDPLIEFFYRIGVGAAFEDLVWHYTLKLLAAHFGVNGDVEQQVSLLDPRVQWRYWTNVWYNAVIWSGVWCLGAPLRRIRKHILQR
jgi:hypothetical protein